MKWLKKTAIILIGLPFALIACIGLYEIGGMYVNQAETARQTEQLQSSLKQNIPDITIKDVYSETGNTSGTGNHVDCLTIVTFTTKMTEREIKDKMSRHYDFDEWYGGCYIEKMQNGDYQFYLNKTAPFADNIMGH